MFLAANRFRWRDNLTGSGNDVTSIASLKLGKKIREADFAYHQIYGSYFVLFEKRKITKSFLLALGTSTPSLLVKTGTIERWK